MRTLESLGRLLALLELILVVGAPAARAQTVWSMDFDISDGDVNDTFTPLNNQRSVAVDDSSNLYILFYDNLVLSSPSLIIPHARLHERAFVLVPLAEIAPDFVHPVLKQTVSQLLAQVERAGIKAVE